LFGGGYSGKYQIEIRHLVFGLLNTDGIILDVGTYVSSVSPLQGSIYGGTVLTIKGSNFGTVYTDNPVQISFLGAIGSRDCFVEKTGPTEIQCRLDSSEVQEDKKVGTVIVFLKTSEEATCPAEVCKKTFVYTSAVPTITSAGVLYEAASKSWKLEARGTGFTGDANSVKLMVGSNL
jgi:hypothetical protein